MDMRDGVSHSVCTVVRLGYGDNRAAGAQIAALEAIAYGMERQEDID